MGYLSIAQLVCLVPVIGGAVFQALSAWAALRFRRRQRHAEPTKWPSVSILKCVHGLEHGLRENLRSACRQDYPDYEVVLSVQRRDDPAIPLIREIESEFGSERVRVAIEERIIGTNGKINNLAGGLPYARNDVLVISDSDIRLSPGYLKAIVAPLADPNAGYVCTPFKAVQARTWYEKMELLALNAEFTPSVIFAYETGASDFCLGGSTALRRETLDRIGGLAPLADFLVEDYEMGRRICELGLQRTLVPYCVDTMVNLESAGDWWSHQVYWDQNTKAARPGAFFGTVLIKSAPFALLFAGFRLADPLGLAVLIGSFAFRLATSASTQGWGLGDREGVRALYLLPLRDLLGFASWLLAFTRRTTTWRGVEFDLTSDGRLVARKASESAIS